jgi:hypothetical protein
LRKRRRLCLSIVIIPPGAAVNGTSANITV